MAAGKRASYELTAATTETIDERPRSFYDNLTTTGSTSGTTKIIQIPDIQFKFDDDIPITTDARRSTLMSNAKSDFFGLSRPSPVGDGQSHPTLGNDDDESQNLIDDSERRTPPSVIVPSAPGSSSSPVSNASTVPARSSSPGTTDDSPRVGAEEGGSNKSRPISSNRSITIRLPDSGTPSEAVYMTTTVPQNFAKDSSALIGRHKPTRSSLRHSRMLVVNKSFHQRYPRGNSLNLKHIRLSRVLMVLKILIGAILTFVGLAIMVWSPSTHTKDNPYWAGLVLILCGSMFLILFNLKRRPANRLRESCFNFVRVNALLLLLLTIFFTMLAFIYALMHTVNLSSSGLHCEPEYSFNVNSSSCVCWIDVQSSRSSGQEEASQLTSDQLLEDESLEGNSSSTTVAGLDRRGTPEQWEKDGAIRLEYRDFRCSEVLGIWYYVTLGSTVLNSLGCLLAAVFLVIYGVECQRREQQLKYFGVRSNGNGTGMRLAERSDEDTEKQSLDTGGRSSATSTEKPSNDDDVDGPFPVQQTHSDSNVTDSIGVKTTEA
ncbi:uncharacterized protein LOC131426453 [Malaya genurostris]|uniref:uncharacterized protein LOC131426453 n=1 Tax=Malaya genurostris TaxID=325434 RepID=UPI0026F3BA1E|nr:uncharacterized protein LOC131426453 [Malaya genurostris]